MAGGTKKVIDKKYWQIIKKEEREHGKKYR